MFKEWLRFHQTELTVAAIGFAISFVISLALTGDFGEAFARRKRM